MTHTALEELNRIALDPARSVVVEAVAGSGKTWLLVARMVRLLIDGVAPSEILAITFTRKAAQEMAERLRDSLYLLATESEQVAREFLRQRQVPENELEDALKSGRLLYERFLTAHPPLTIATFHSWFLQLLKRAPLEAGALGEVNLVEQTGALIDEAWQRFGARVQREPESPVAHALDRLFCDYGLDSTRKLLRNFVSRRAEWWAYTRGEGDQIAWALQRIASDMSVDPHGNVAQDACHDEALLETLAAFAALLAHNTSLDLQLAQAYTRASASANADTWLRAACDLVLKMRTDRTLRVRKANATQAKRLGKTDEARMLDLHEELGARLLTLWRERADQICYKVNEAALTCGVALVETYQAVKAERQVLDYGDIEWHAHNLLSVSDHAVYMHCKLDSRYRHILLDEFQDTNPMQWLTLKSWFAAAAEVDVRPVVFLVGDPKQSIYRFRRAEARLFDEAAQYLEREFGARRVLQQQSRRCAPAVIDVVNALFSAEAEFKGYERHTAHDPSKRGRVEVLPLVGRTAAEKSGSDPDLSADVKFSKVGSDPDFSDADTVLSLRNPFEHAFEIDEDLRRERESIQLVERIGQIVGVWHILDDKTGTRLRPARYEDIMILVKRRTHLRIYEHALRAASIPYITSRLGGLLGTLEAQDMVALLEFIVSPFADLRLAHALRSPIFGCSDRDLMAIAQIPGDTWWERLGRLAAEPGSSAEVRRAHELLARWRAQSDVLPVHDQLDRIYFEGDVTRRYRASTPEAMRESVVANLEAFMQRALDTDAGRYPSLPRFLHELMDLAEGAPQDAPDEGIVGNAGDAVRIYTVHGAKGLEAPIVWLLDVGAGKEPGESYEAVIDWPPNAEAPAHFSVCTRKAEHSSKQRELAEFEDELVRREDLNLLYVAMTRAQQALFVSGCDGQGREGSWYDKVRCAVRKAAATDLTEDDVSAAVHYGVELTTDPGYTDTAAKVSEGVSAPIDPRLATPLPSGVRRTHITGRGQRYGTHFHQLMERLTAASAPAPSLKSTEERAAIQRALGFPDREFGPMWDSAQRLLKTPALARYFDPAQYRRAANEVAYVTATGEVRRIDRLVEFDDELWVLDYKTGAPPADIDLMRQYESQLVVYGEAMETIAPGKQVKGLLLFTGGEYRVIGEQPPEAPPAARKAPSAHQLSLDLEPPLHSRTERR